MYFARPDDGWSASPLDELTILGAAGATLCVLDGEGREYLRAPVAPAMSFTVAGSLGTHTVQALDAAGMVMDTLTFVVDAATSINDAGGRFNDLHKLLYKTMCCYSPDGTGSTTFRGKTYKSFVPWILDHVHTAKGMQYFSSATSGLIELFALAQREDGLIWSFVEVPERDGVYHFTAYGKYGYAKYDSGLIFGRQPVENHNEANFVDGVFLSWKGSGDDVWMAAHLDAAIRALNYSASSEDRWSSVYQLLKKGYTIDSWDFQVKDKHSVKFALGSEAQIDAKRTKFGIFFGDNTGYMLACSQLAEMLQAAGRTEEAESFRQRHDAIHQRLTALAWNGRFFTHHVEEDPAIHRELGVDESTQIAMSNAYAMNRCISHEQCVAIVRTYQDLRQHLPAGSPGEWYAIYPPFPRGFEHGGAIWQYMNGGVHPHAAGELARGAFEHGFEQYGADILLRMRELGHKYNERLSFAYTGATETPPPPQVFTPVSLAEVANMDITDAGAPGVLPCLGGEPGNDLRNLPVGPMTFAEVPYLLADPSANGRRVAVAVSQQAGYPTELSVPIQARAGALYLVHVASQVAVSGLAGAVTLHYTDGTVATQYMKTGTHMGGFWFPKLSTPTSGIAWEGANECSNSVGVSWVALPNPHPAKTIERVTFTATLDNAIYAIFGLTLADRMPYHAPSPVSFGGPDNWGGGTCAYALTQGLAGVKDTDRAFHRVRLSPRWVSAEVDEVAVTLRYPASQGYISYQYRHDAQAKKFTLNLTGSGETVSLRLLLPEGCIEVESVSVEDEKVAFNYEQVETSRYLCLPIALGGLRCIMVQYR